ncbi:DUF6796 family protein [Tenacibaculum xiamenense]|uniref:DUF6796 family protein n=1 Tax=Tenacibaculum xiamenense TaxID=1261553 RepID=UPI003895AB6D
MKKQTTLFKTAGLLAIFGGVLTYISDHMLRGEFAPGSAVGIIDVIRTGKLAYEPLYWGSLLGYATLPLYLLGLWPLYRALEPAGRVLATIPVILLGYALALFPGYHYAAILYALGFESANNSSNSLLSEQLMQVLDGTHMIIMPTVILSSLWIAVLILSGKTLYARWMVIASPLLMVLIPILVVKMIPSPWGGYIIPGSGTIGLIIFFAMAVWVSWPTSKTDFSKDQS